MLSEHMMNQWACMPCAVCTQLVMGLAGLLLYISSVTELVYLQLHAVEPSIVCVGLASAAASLAWHCQLQVAGRHASLNTNICCTNLWVRWKYFVLLARLLERSRARRSSFCWNRRLCHDESAAQQ